MKFFKNIGKTITNSFKIVYYKTIIRYYKLLQDIFHSYPFHYNTTNNPPSKLGQDWLTQLKTTYSIKDEQQESIERSHKKVDTINEI